MTIDICEIYYVYIHTDLHPPLRVNKQYDAVLQASTFVFNSTTALEWEQLYVGIARGLGSINTNITACVEDGNITVETFRQSFIAFENREIFLGQ